MPDAMESRPRLRRVVPPATLALMLAACAGEPTVTLPPPRLKVLETAPLHLDRIYTSMAGPFHRSEVDFSDLDWVTAYRSEVIDAESGDAMGGEFLCHTQLQMLNGTRLLVTATGTEEIRFPPGFGMTVGQILGDVDPGQRALSFLGMVLNNHVSPIDRLVRVRATVEYRSREEVGDPPRLKKLYKAGLTMEVEDLARYEPPEGTPESDDVSTHCVLVGEQNSHWVVPPGPQRTRKQYRDFLPVDATVHFAVVHLHNHGRYLRLTDATTGERLWQSDVVYEPDRVQIARIPTYASVEGFPVYKDHVYEIEAFYDNTSGEDVDAMAQIDLYYHPSSDVDITYPSGTF
jgi:hypothetical protein